MKLVYKYPQSAFPYEKLVEENRRRWGQTWAPEYELLDTGVFDQDRYFDVFVEYAKAGPEDLCIRIEAINRGPDAAELNLIPHLWFHNWWAWTDPPGPKRSIRWLTELDYININLPLATRAARWRPAPRCS